MSKRRRKEKSRKAEHEKIRQPVEDVAGGGEEKRAAEETELPVTPSMDVPKAMTGSPIKVEKIREPSERQEDVVEPRPYAPDWMIYPGT